MGIKAGLVSGEGFGSVIGGFPAHANLTITDVTSGTAETIVITDGSTTKTIVINETTNGITITWS